MAHWFRTTVALAAGPGSTSGTPGSQLSLAQVPRDPMFLSYLHEHETTWCD